MRSRTLLKIYVSINLKHRSGKLDSLIWLFFRYICTSLWTEPHHSVLISCSVLKDLSNIKNPILQKNSTLHAEKTESELCKLPFVFLQEKLKHFFSPYTFDERFFFVAESVRSCKPSNFNCIHPGLPLQDISVWAAREHSPEDWIRCQKGWNWSLGASGLQKLPVLLCRDNRQPQWTSLWSEIISERVLKKIGI